uniref:DH domain-containing protein n=1 Tax=Rhabditophanes sp. KR3021 TaxID=114890 RepID=A0AC35TWW6_9BILA
MSDSPSLTLFHHLRGNCHLEKSNEATEIHTLSPNRDQLVRRDALTGLEKETDDDVENNGSTNTQDNVIIVPHMQISTNDMHLFNRAISSGGSLLADLQRATMAAQNFYEDNESTKSRSPWVLKRLYEWSHRAKSREIVKHVESALMDSQINDEEDMKLMKYLDCSWDQLFPGTSPKIDDKQRRQYQAVWELFHSELIFLFRQLYVLKYVYKEPLKKCQVEGCLLTAEPQLLFGNLEQIIKISQKFCHHFMALLLIHQSTEKVDNKVYKKYDIPTMICLLIDKFLKAQNTISAFQAYCINYKANIEYIVLTREKEDRFAEYEKVCAADPRAGRLTMDDMLICPLQRVTRIPILLKEIHKSTVNPQDQDKLQVVIDLMRESLQSIDDSVEWLHNFELVQHLQNQVVWPNILELESKTFMPDFLKNILNRQFCENLLAHPRRKLNHNGNLQIIESGGKLSDCEAYLFNDMFLMTKPKKTNAKAKRGSNVGTTKNEMYTVIKQPIPLDSCVFCDAESADTPNTGSSNLKNAFVVIHLTRYYQVVSVNTFQATDKADKELWINKFQESIENYECIQLKDMLKCTPLFSNLNVRRTSKNTNGKSKEDGKQDEKSAEAEPKENANINETFPNSNGKV